MALEGRRPRSRRLLFLLGFPLVALVLVASLGLGQFRNDDADPRNASKGLLYQGADCLSCHRSWGMVDSHIIVPLVPRAIDINTPRDIGLQIYNPWKAAITEIKVELTLKGGEPLLVPLAANQADARPDSYRTWTGQLANPAGVALPGAPASSKAVVRFDVGEGAVAMFGNASFYPAGGAPAAPPTITASFFQPRSTAVPFQESSNTKMERNFTLPRGELHPMAGHWRVEFEFTNGTTPSPALWTDYWFGLTVVYAAVDGAKPYEVVNLERVPPAGGIPQQRVEKLQTLDLPPIPVLGLGRGTQKVEIMVQAHLWYPHQGSTINEEIYQRYFTTTIDVGDVFIPTAGKAVVAGVSKQPFTLVAGELAGFSAGILLFPSLVLGGAYGRGSRKVINDLLGGAKRRVMFHNLVSMGLTLVALVHIVLFLVEIRYSVLMGVLWGGLGALSLLVLGLTGYYQVPLIQKYGHRWWRVTHLTVGLLVIVFVAVHALADGRNFFFLREHLPQWLQGLNLAQK